jgi:hypothetical protein
VIVLDLLSKLREKTVKAFIKSSSNYWTLRTTNEAELWKFRP